MKENKTKKTFTSGSGFSLLHVIIIIFVTAITSAIATGVIVNNGYKNKDGMSYSELLEDDNLKEFLNVYSSVVSGYYEDVNKQEMVDAALNAMLNYLGDSYTTYMNENQAESLAEKLEGTYKGIGITIEGRKIIGITKNSPAQYSGLQIDDEIIKINDVDVTSKNASEIVTLIKNQNLEEVKMVVNRNNEDKEFTIKTADLFVPALSYNLIENTKIGYIYISIFSNTVYDQFNDALKDLEAQGMEKLIIDVRDNTGGYLTQAEQIASLFLQENKVIYSLENKNGTKTITDKTSEARDYPIIVVINNDSASASEILAAALKDSYNATLVGTKSYGKGKVQQTVTLSDKTLAKYTSAKWLRPNGKCIDKVGMMPDYEVELDITKDESGNIVAITDTQLQKAIDLLK